MKYMNVEYQNLPNDIVDDINELKMINNITELQKSENNYELNNSIENDLKAID